MIPAWRKPSNVETAEEVARNKEIKKRLIHELSITVKELQKTHLDGDLEIDKNDQYALMLCTLIEAAMLHGYQEHGLKMSNFYNLLGKISSESMPSHSFWNFLVHFTHKDVIQELQHLSHITTPVGHCRAWVRLALNDCLMESYLDAMLTDIKKIKMFYKPSSFMLEEELPYIMISFLQGLTEFKFNLNYNTPSLNTWTGDTLALAGIWQLPKFASFSSQPSNVFETSGTTTSISQSPPTLPSNMSSVPANRPLTIPHERSIYEDVEVARSVHEGTDGLQVIDEDVTEREVLIEEPQIGQDESDMIEEEPINTEELSNCMAESSNEKIPNAEIDRSTTISPVPMMGSNKLGVSTGWSSAFDTAVVNTATATTKVKEAEAPGEVKIISRPAPPKDSQLTCVQSTHGMPSYTNLLSNYTVQGQANFDTSVYNGEDGEKKREKRVKKIPIPKPKSPEEEPQMPGFEVVPQSSSLLSEHTDDRTHLLMSILTQISNEKGLDSQNYQCKGCGRNIGMIYGEAKVCTYDGCYYCYECHIDDEHVIPARIIYNWDLRKHKVCRSTKLFLLQIEEEPLLNIDETNPSLYEVVDELQEIKMLRKQLLHLKGFIFTCKEPIADEVRRRIWPREYLWDDIHQYSLLDLIQTNSGQLAHHLKKILAFCQKHVYKCKLCCQKGFICEFCNDPKIIYPFQVKTTSQCPDCKAVFHKPCIADRSCPKCARRRKKKAATLKSTTLEFDSPW